MLLTTQRLRYDTVSWLKAGAVTTMDMLVVERHVRVTFAAVFVPGLLGAKPLALQLLPRSAMSGAMTGVLPSLHI